MDRVKVIGALNRVLAVLSRSLPCYLDQTSPWTGPAGEEAQSLLSKIASQQRQFARQIATAVGRHRGQVEMDGFPTEFTAANDLSVEFLITKVIGCQKHDIESLQSAVNDLALEPWLQVLAQDVLTALKEQLESLETLAARRRATPA